MEEFKVGQRVLIVTGYNRGKLARIIKIEKKAIKGHYNLDNHARVYKPQAFWDLVHLEALDGSSLNPSALSPTSVLPA